MGKSCETLTLAEIQEINRLVIQKFKGNSSGYNHNLCNQNSLEYILEAIVFPIYDQDRYPGLFNKIAALIHTIICKHVFYDGNKRTAMAVCLVMLDKNGYSFKIDKQTENFFVRISAETCEVKYISEWIQQHARIKVSCKQKKATVHQLQFKS